MERDHTHLRAPDATPLTATVRPTKEKRAAYRREVARIKLAMIRVLDHAFAALGS